MKHLQFVLLLAFLLPTVPLNAQVKQQFEKWCTPSVKTLETSLNELREVKAEEAAEKFLSVENAIKKAVQK